MRERYLQVPLKPLKSPSHSILLPRSDTAALVSDVWSWISEVQLKFKLTDFLPSSKTHRFWLDGVGWGGAITFICTYTHTWCYATARSSSTATHTWCYATARSSSTATHMWCYATARSSSTATHTWCYATARSSSTATFIKQLSWFDFGPLQEEKTLRGLLLEKLNPQVRRPLFSVKIDVSLWRNDNLVINMRTVKIPPGSLRRSTAEPNLQTPILREPSVLQNPGCLCFNCFLSFLPLFSFRLLQVSG